MGDILRGLTAAHPLFEAVQGYLRQGNLVPDDLVMDLFTLYVEPLGPAPNDLLVIDGIPRNRRQVERLQGIVEVIKIFKLSVYDENIVIDRIRRRARAQNRTDDASDEVIRHRMAVYRNETESCITAFPGTILTRIQANQSVFDVHLDIISALGKMRNIHFQ
jgi:adenylate kinase family enzyme